MEQLLQSLFPFLAGYATDVFKAWAVDKGKQGLNTALTAFSGPADDQPPASEDSVLPSGSDEADDLWQDRGEPLRFLTRQRVRYRIALAKERWELLRVIAHYHPLAGQRQRLPLSQNPQALNGIFTVADLAAGPLPGEKERFLDSVPSKVRLLLVDSSLQRISNITATIEQGLEPSIHEVPVIAQIKKPNWLSDAGFVAWVTFLCETAEKHFPEKKNLKSFSGFKTLTFVDDTPVAGIRQRDQHSHAGAQSGNAGGCNIFAYAAIMELACLLSRSEGEFSTIYNQHYDPRKASAHKYALGRTAVKILDRAHSFLAHNPPPRFLITPTVTFSCSSCQGRLVAKSKLWGKSCKCPKCGQVVAVPSSDEYGKSAAASFQA